MKYNVKNGLGKCYIAKVTAEGYDTVKELGALQEISVSTAEESAVMYAGNGIIIQDSAIGETDVTISIPALSEELEAEIFGHTLATEGGIIKNTNDSKPYFALMFEQTAKNNETGANVTDYITLYKGMFNQAERKGKGKEGKPEFQNCSLSGKFSAKEDGVLQYIVSSDSTGFNAETFKTKWGKTVIVPTKKVSA